MSTRAKLAIACLLFLDGFMPTAHAACCVKTMAVETSTVVVPVPVTIGVPVAQAAPYYYSYQSYAPQTSFEPGESTIEAIAARVVEKLRNANASTPQNAMSQSNSLRPTANSLVQLKCASCHGGPQAKANLRLDEPATLDCATRLKAIRAVLSEKMPKGGPPLTPEEAGKVLEELSAP
jgi:hypothetical protein